MPRPVCVSCEREMVAVKSGAVSFFAKVVGKDRPYEQYQGDLFECGGCKTQIVARYGGAPTFRHHDEGQPEAPIAKAYEFVMLKDVGMATDGDMPRSRR